MDGYALVMKKNADATIAAARLKALDLFSTLCPYRYSSWDGGFFFGLSEKESRRKWESWVQAYGILYERRGVM